MAIDPAAQYPTRTNPADADYPFGSAKDRTTQGTGYPWEEDTINDHLGFFQRLLSEAGITPSGNPDTVQASDYFDALRQVRSVRSIPVGSLIEHYGRNPDSEIYAESGSVIDSSVFTAVRNVVPPVLDMAQQSAASPFTNNFMAAAFGAGVFVLAGASGEIQTSSDGAAWTHRTPDASFTGTFGAAIFANSIFLLGGFNSVQTSSDGITWASVTISGADSVLGAAWDGSQFVIVGSTGGIRTSPDGAAWTPRTQAGGYAGTFADVVWNGSIFVAVGTGTEIQTSPDGVTWTQRTEAAGATGAIESVTWDGVQFIAVGGGGEIQTSPDGAAWTLQTPADSYTGNFFSVEYVDGSIIAGGSSGEIQTSTGGEVWESREPDASYAGSFRSIASNGVDIVLCGTSAEIQTGDTTDRLVPTFASTQVGFTQYMCIS